ncbi:MAG: CDP-alcohol phosphatidyltransferase family protein [Oscillospiraceae bacterium]|jgi:cardiolipin synthase|nr:CDP-alcohol phosphatidyltransferase family protein [Oscillospiraceae bacterium]
MPDKGKQILTIPNLLSVFRILLIPLIVWLYCGKQDYLLAAWVLLLSGVTDIADGFIARRFHMVSDLGKVLDPIADKLTQTAALVCLLTRFRAVWWLLGVLVVKETVMTVMGLLVIRRTGSVYSASWHGKLATCVLYAVIFTHIVWYGVPQAVSMLLVLAGAASILLSLALYTMEDLKRIREGRPQ